MKKYYKLNYILKHKEKFKNKVLYIGILGLTVEDIEEHIKCFSKKDVFCLESQVLI